uniref:Ribonuclease H-like domain-containing protein n=1 Tax=Tanacetum cinerariifolium TaxID=118510 RepID=A0A699GQA3_TANCI|nr:ribonuclease H-like domain-containing protein [Tanacetum cinerariifolium]
MYDGAKTRVRTSIGSIEFFPVDVGLHQGSTISPCLFALILDELSRGIQEDIPWCLIFADDIVLVSESAKEYLRCDFGIGEIAQNEEVDIRVGDKILQPKESFRYLGSMLHKSRRIDKEGGSSGIKNAKADLWRRTHSAPVRRVDALVVDELRRRGRPKLRWEDRVKHDMKELLLSEDMTSDRNEWRTRIRVSACLFGLVLCGLGFAMFFLLVLFLGLVVFASFPVVLLVIRVGVWSRSICRLVLALPAPVVVDRHQQRDPNRDTRRATDKYRFNKEVQTEVDKEQQRYIYKFNRREVRIKVDEEQIRQTTSDRSDRSSNVDTSMLDSSPDVNRNVKKEWEKVSSKSSSIESAVDPFDGLDEILGDYANTGKQITEDESNLKHMLVHVGISSKSDDFSFGKFKEVEVKADTELEEEESDTEGNDTSVETRRQLILVKNDNEMVRVRCEGTIPALVPYVAIDTNMDKNVFSQTKDGPVIRENNNSGKQNILGKDKTVEGKGWEVRTLNEDHTCIQSRAIKACTSRFLADHVIKSLLTNPDIPVRAVQDQMQKQFEVGVSKMKALKAKRIAYDIMTLANEGTVTHIKTDENGQFETLFICFGFAKIQRNKSGSSGNGWQQPNYTNCCGCHSRPKGVKKLELASFKKWSRAYCPANRYNYVTSNSVESVNSLSWIVQKLPLTRLIEYFRDLLQRWYYAPADELTPWAAVKVKYKMLNSANWKVNDIDSMRMYQVIENQATQKCRSYNKRVTHELLTSEAPLDEERLRNGRIYQDWIDVVQPEPKASRRQRSTNYSCPLQMDIEVKSSIKPPNRVLVTKPHNKIPYELLIGSTPNLRFMKPFRCPVTILNTLDHLGKFEGKADEGFLVGYSVNSKAFRVFNSRTRRVEENLHIRFLENKLNVAGRGPEWLFDIDSLKNSMNYEPVTAGNQTNNDACIEKNANAVKSGQEKASDHDYILLSFMSPNTQSLDDKDTDEVPDNGDEGLRKESGVDDQEKTDSGSKDVNTTEPNTGIFDDAYDDRDVGAEAGTNNLDISTVSKRTSHKDYQNCLFACFISQQEPKKVLQALADPSWIEAMQEELLQFKLPKVWNLVDLPYVKRAIDTKRVFRNKKEDRGIVIRNKARLVAQGHTQEESIDYDEIMHKRFQMSSIRELTFFLGLQVKQKDDGIFISQDKYVAGILKKFNFTTVKTTSTPMEPNKTLIKDAEAEDVPSYTKDFTSSCCEENLQILKSLERKSTTGGCQFLGKRLILWQCKKQTIVENSTSKAEYVDAASCYGHVLWIQNQMLDYGLNLMNIKIYIDNEIDGKKIILNEASIKRDLRLDDAEGTACLLNDDIFARLARMGMVKNLEAGVKFYMFPRFVQVFINNHLGEMSHQKGIFVNPSLTKKVFANMKRVGAGFSGVITPLYASMMRKHTPRRKQREATKVTHTEPQVEEYILTPSHDLLPSGEDRLQLSELMEICTKLSDRVLSLEQTKTTQAAEIKKLKKRVKKLEGKKKENSWFKKEDASKQRRITEIDVAEDLFLIDETAHDQGRINDQDMFGVHNLDGDEVFMDVTTGENVEQGVIVSESVKGIAVATTPQITKDERTLAQTLMEIKAFKPKTKGVTIQEPSEFRTTSPSQPPQAKDKGKGIMVEPEKPLKKKDQIALDEEATIDADRQLAKQIQAQEKEQLSIKKRYKLLAELIESRRKYFAAKRDEEIMNKPPTKGQHKSLMYTYMKNIEGFKQKDFKRKNFDDIKKMFDKVYKRVNTFVDISTENIEESLKKLKKKEGKKSYFKIIRADGNSQNYLTFRTMFKNFNREDLEVLRSLVKERFEKTKPVDDMENLLFQTLMIMFEHAIEDNIWKYQHGVVKVHNWKLYDSCGVYCVTTKNMVYYLLVEKMYPLTNNILHQLWKDVRLQVDYEVKMAYDILKLIRRQINEGYKPE